MALEVNLKLIADSYKKSNDKKESIYWDNHKKFILESIHYFASRGYPFVVFGESHQQRYFYEPSVYILLPALLDAAQASVLVYQLNSMGFKTHHGQRGEGSSSEEYIVVFGWAETDEDLSNIISL